jgi:molybdate transport system substrate-binding protein
MLDIRSALAALWMALVLAPALAKEAAPAPAVGAQAGSVTIFAAASLKDALDRIAGAYKAKTGVDAKISYASSSTLAKQIEAGAPADVFLSADAASMDYLAERKLIDTGSRADLLGNALVLVAPRRSKLEQLALTKEALTAAIGSVRIATGDLASVPVGRYAKAAFEKLGLWDVVSPHFVFADNVRSALAFVALEEATLGVVYLTDAKSEPRVKIVATFPAASHPPIVYPVALTSAASPAGSAFLNFLKSSEAKAIFRDQGFAVAP